jgi:DNA-binding NtrC family response regulator
MIRIAVAGSLANSLGDFLSAKLRTRVSWAAVSNNEFDPNQFDLILGLSNDPPADHEITPLVKDNQLLACIISQWNSLPSLDELDDAIQQSLSDVYGFVVGYAADTHEVCRWIRAVAHQATAALDLRTLIIGETGTGKELVAAAIHKLGQPKGAPFVTLNCGAFPTELIDSELFGHRRGAFTSAVADREGALKRATGGLLFLDEIGDMPIGLQARFLRVLEQRTFSPLGSDESYALLTQIVSATNHRLDESVREGKFRADLYFRIAQLTVTLPPLRERLEDVPLLVDFFLRQRGLTRAEMDQRAIERMQRYDWPGNIRELRTTVDRFVLLFRSGSVDGTEWLSIPESQRSYESAEGQTLAARREAFDRQVLSEVLARCAGDTKRAAEELGITQRSVYNLAHRYNLSLKTKDQ